MIDRKIIFVLLLICISCGIIDTSNSVTKTYDLLDFTKLKVQGIYTVELLQDSLNYIEVTADEKIIDHLDFSYDSTFLYINDKIPMAGIRNFEHPIIRLHFTYIHQIFLESTVKLYTIKPITGKSMMIDSGGELADIDMEYSDGDFLFYTYGHTNGIYRFSGNVTQCDVQPRSASKVDISELNSPRKRVLNYSVADVYVGTCDELEVGIYDRGKVYYYGEPSLKLLTEDKQLQLIKQN